MHSAGALGNENIKTTIKTLLNARIDAQGDKLAGSAKDLIIKIIIFLFND